VWGHDKHLVDAKTKYYMDEQVDGKTREAHPKKTTLPTKPDANGKQQHHHCLNDIAQIPSIRHEYWAMNQCVFEEVILMKLYRLAKEILVG
jgi:hypothetical protein